MPGFASASPLARHGGAPVAGTARQDGTIRSRADVTTGAPARYAKQLTSHLGRKVPFTGDATAATAAIGGASAGVVVGEGVLTLLAAGDDEESVARVEWVLGSHLERFAQREGLTVRWLRTHPTPNATSASSPARVAATTTEESA